MHTTCMMDMFPINLDVVDPCWGVKCKCMVYMHVCCANDNVHMVHCITYFEKE